MYELYDKNGKFICYRMTKRIKNDLGEYDVLTARSKKSEKECRKIMDDKIRDYYIQQEEQKHKGVSSKMLFKEFADNWFELNVKNADCSQVNKENYKNYTYTHIIPYFKDYRLCDIYEDDCQRFLNQYVGYSKAMVSKLRMTLRRILRKAMKQKLIADNPAEDIILPKVTQGQRRPITDKERAMILETAKTHYAGAMVLTMLYCGLRPIEVRNLKWADIDLKQDLLTVTKSKTVAGTGRKLPIPPQLKSALIEHKLKGQNDVWVFVRCKNHSLPLDENAFYHAWHNFCREMDISNGATVYRNQIIKSTLSEDLEPYLLRHTFCTDCQSAGVPLNVAKELMGHSDISVTAKIYTHMVDEVFEQNRKRLAEYAQQKQNQYKFR
jgi:integrase